MIPPVAVEYRRRHSQLLLALLVALRQAWRRLNRDGSWEDQYATDVGPRVMALLLAAQTSTTRAADTYIAALLNELAFGPRTSAGVVPPTAFLGLAGDGRPAQTLLASAVGRARASLAEQRRMLLPDVEQTPELRDRFDTPAMRQKGLDDGEAFLQRAASTVLADTMRAAETAAIVQRTWVSGYVRMINPPSCSRCVILAGRFYRWNEGFARHPKCDCTHIPVSESIASDVRVNPDDYFHSLTPAEQDRVFTKAGADAVRNGADIFQVVNARRGMTTAQIGGREYLVTTEGTTRRGVAYNRLTTGDDVRRDGERYRRARRPRLMPETIADVAKDRDDAIRLLRANGFII